MRNVIYYLIAGTKGGETRARIINNIKQEPKNSYKIANTLNLDYKTVQHHLKILIDNGVFIRRGSYGAVYFISNLMDENMRYFDEIWDKLGRNRD